MLISFLHWCVSLLISIIDISYLQRCDFYHYICRITNLNSILSMRNKVIPLLFLILPSLAYSQDAIKNQSDALSVSEMIQLFKDRGIETSQPVYDRLYVPDYFYEPSFIYPSPLKDLSPLYSGQWRIPRRDCGYLFLESIRSCNKDSLKQASFHFAQIKGQYGTPKTSEVYRNLPTNYDGIVASWYTGRLFVLHCPKKLFNTVVSKKASNLNIEQGRLVKEEKVVLEEGAFESSCFPQEGDLVVIREDGCWYDDIKPNIEYSIVPFINKDFPVKLSRYSGKEFSFLLEIEPKTGKITSHLLLPETLAASDEKIVRYLKGRIDQLPINSFGPLITINQRLLYGRYLKFVVENGHFTIEDYLDN